VTLGDLTNPSEKHRVAREVQLAVFFGRPRTGRSRSRPPGGCVRRDRPGRFAALTELQWIDADGFLRPIDVADQN